MIGALSLGMIIVVVIVLMIVVPSNVAVYPLAVSALGKNFQEQKRIKDQANAPE